jgi:MerR family transcriptional regulator/heat shock protein HspR
MHVNTLRKYERHGLIAPGRTAGNQRSFTQQDLARLEQIKRLVDDHGVNLAGVNIALTVTDRIQALRLALGVQPGVADANLNRALDDILLALLATAVSGCRSQDSLEDTGD